MDETRRLWRSTGIHIAKLAAAGRAMSMEDFVERYGRAFLLIQTSMRATHTLMENTRSGEGVSTGDMVVAAFPLRRPPRSDHPFVTVGRLDGNDVCLNDITVSKFHAFILEENGRFFVQDARSKNGTTVAARPVPARGEGPPVQLAVGDVVRFGSVATGFVDAEGVLALATQRGDLDDPSDGDV